MYHLKTLPYLVKKKYIYIYIYIKYSGHTVLSYTDYVMYFHRHAALEIERERATEIASLPPPAPDICLDMDKKSSEYKKSYGKFRRKKWS